MWPVLFLDTVPNVFYSPYQDQPLDLLYGAVFYARRQTAVDTRLQWLDVVRGPCLLAELSELYRAHYRCRCVGMSWSHPLHILQVSV